MSEGLFPREGPLADALRPASLDEVLGQEALLGAESGALRVMLDAGKLSSLILWGPPGSGKTTIARLLAGALGVRFVQISAVFSGVSDLRKVFDEARRHRGAGAGTVLFVDEIHRFNRAQQDSFLPYVEDGTIVLIGATTENPSFELINALLSRCRVLEVRRLGEEHLEELLRRAEAHVGRPLPLEDGARAYLAGLCDGDGRYVLNLAEALFGLPEGSPPLSAEMLGEFLQRRVPLYDKSQEGHYNLISALHKSMRGSDPDAALYWFARMLRGGEDPRYIARRLVRFAVEDVGLADARALGHAVAAWKAYERLGSPEGELALANAVVLMATAEKSNAVYVGFKEAWGAAGDGSLMPPRHILNAPTGLMRDLGYGEGYLYDHDEEGGFSGQDYFPEGMERRDFYRPGGAGDEGEIKARLERWRALRREKKTD
ncbi:MAG: replication-associated recombination protein A [Alphaproteobacteria bacterium]|nr:replication-associated recombination protein A [Alphaproteobacteria bacterium]MDA7983400.1 replication-associated recombination protein A [Alphaproteobacteria bacterium]MDA7988989.1 replication-associated recombination protein A [Alphaproteobacteria bacterium]